MDAHLTHDANCYISVCGEHYADLVAERDALREALEEIAAHAEDGQLPEICYLPMISIARAALKRYE